MENIQIWRRKHCISFRDEQQLTKELGKGYWRGFMKRNGLNVKAKKGVKFDSKRADWCTYQNFEAMYADIYKEMVMGKIAEELEQEVWFDKEGDVVETEGEAFGLQTKYKLTRPDKLLFVDEVGSNTSQAKDGQIGGEKFLVNAAGRPQQRSALKDAHFTVLGFTAADGYPVMCAIIFAAKQLEIGWVQGLDPFAEWIGTPDNIPANTGPGKRYPQGPICMLNGTTMPTMCCCSDSGSITAELLAAMLKQIDSSNIFDRSDGIPPFLLLDGHGSRFDLAFLEYINSPLHPWHVCIGVPYGTSYWQVGDSTEQNGCFKMHLTQAKRDLLTKKALYHLPFAIEKTDVVGIVAHAWEKSFARLRTNKKAVAERGWGPLNYNCLLNPEIQLTKFGVVPLNRISHSNRTSITPDQLNLREGLSGTLTNQIVEYINREDVRNGNDAAEHARKRKQTAQAAIDTNK